MLNATVSTTSLSHTLGVSGEVEEGVSRERKDSHQGAGRGEEWGHEGHTGPVG